MAFLGNLKVKDHLNEKEIVRLHRELVVPTAVHDVLKGLDPLDDTAQYAIDSMIAEMPVDAALLCLSLSAAHIAHDLQGAHPVAGPLAIETGRMVHEYGPTWLAHVDGQLNARDVFAAQNQFTETMAEEFESLAALLAECGADMPEHGDHAILCDMLSEHARAYATYTNAMVCGDDLGIIVESMDAAPVAQTSDVMANNVMANNIVAFPGVPKPA